MEVGQRVKVRKVENPGEEGSRLIGMTGTITEITTDPNMDIEWGGVKYPYEVKLDQLGPGIDGRNAYRHFAENELALIKA